MASRTTRRLVAGGAVAAAIVSATLLVALPNSFRRVPRPSQRLTRDITVLTYNTHLFKDSPAEIGRELRDPTGGGAPIVWDDDKREPLITARVLASGADIVALQEVWSESLQTRLCARPELAHVYPYRWHFPAEHPTISLPVQALPVSFLREYGWVIGIPGHRRAQLGVIGKYRLGMDAAITIPKQSSGLVLLSKYPLRDVQYTEYPPRQPSIEDDESFSSKGVITATVEPWEGGPTFRVGITHARTDAGRRDSVGPQRSPTHPDLTDQPNLEDLARLTAGPPYGNRPAIMMGDFNVPRSPRVDQEYGTLVKIFARLGAEDAYRRVRGVNDPTVDASANRLFKVFWPGSANPPSCIDYVFYRASGDGLTLRPEHAEVIRSWKYPTSGQPEMDLSDHYPVMVRFRLTRDLDATARAGL